MLYDRDISSRLKKLNNDFPILVLTGSRQTGKTTLLKKLFPNHTYVSLDLPSAAEMAENDPLNFLGQFKKPVIIDEAQYAPKIFRHLKIEVDKNPNQSGQFILTGSQKFNLMKQVSDSLAGRCAWLELESLSLQELKQKYHTINNVDFLYKVLTRGQMPKLWFNEDISEKDYYRSYLATYLERDVRQIVNVTDLRDFERFIRLCALRNAHLLNMAELSRDVGVSLNTIKKWLSVLEASNQITLLEPYFKNTGKRVMKSPKIYFNEVGLTSFLLGIDAETISSSPFIGNLWESLLYSEFRKKQKNIDPAISIWFYIDNRQREVDLLVNEKSFLNFYEIKWTTNPKKNMYLDSVYSDMKKKNKLNVVLGKKYLLCRSEFPIKKAEVNTINIDHVLK